jgi:hypothetical protein
MFSESLTKHIKDFISGFAELHAKLDADILLDFVNPSQTKRNTKWKKHSCKNYACSQRGVSWQTNAIGFRKCDLGLSSRLLSHLQQ